LLVVEGALRVGQDFTIITLSKTVNANEKGGFKPELKARVSVEDKSGASIFLDENGNGKYSKYNLSLAVGNEYRLRIKTADNKEYLSDYVAARAAPDIDSITWKKEKGDVTIYVNSHDNTNNTRYYKWDFDETWEIRSFYAANYQYVGGSTVIFSPLYHYRCWKYNTSNTINIGSSAQLSSDVISEYPLLQIKQGSEKLSVRYSILLRQESLTKKAYEYLMLMKKNTESLGSIFDPLPSDLKGNIRCTSDPGEGVIGYLTASGMTQKRIFITQMDADWRFPQSCLTDYVKDDPDSIRFFMPSYGPIELQFLPGRGAYYLVSSHACTDCVARGGNLAMPSYW
jgi:hypothetical protein